MYGDANLLTSIPRLSSPPVGRGVAAWPFRISTDCTFVTLGGIAVFLGFVRIVTALTTSSVENRIRITLPALRFVESRHLSSSPVVPYA